MVVGNHLFSFFDKKFREGVTRYELHPPSLRTVYFPTAPECDSFQLYQFAETLAVIYMGIVSSLKLKRTQKAAKT